MKNFVRQHEACLFLRKEFTRGFTLVETMVAISILLIAITGPMSAISKSLSQIAIARDQMIAINFAQQGIEAVRQARDSNMVDQLISGSPSPIYWRNGSGGASPYQLIQGEYIAMAFPDLVMRCVGGCDPIHQEPIYQDIATGRHRQFLSPPAAGGYSRTPFTRKIVIGPGNSEMQVTAIVSWTTGGVVKTVQITESLFGISAP